MPQRAGESSPVHDGVRGANRSIVDTMIMTDEGIEIPARYPRTPTVVCVGRRVSLGFAAERAAGRAM